MYIIAKANRKLKTSVNGMLVNLATNVPYHSQLRAIDQYRSLV